MLSHGRTACVIREQSRQEQVARLAEVLQLALKGVHLLEDSVGLASETGDDFARRLHDFHPAEGVHDDGVKSRTAGVRLEVVHVLERHQEKETLRDAGLAAQRVAGLVHGHRHGWERNLTDRAAGRDEDCVWRV